MADDIRTITTNPIDWQTADPEWEVPDGLIFWFYNHPIYSGKFSVIGDGSTELQDLPILSAGQSKVLWTGPLSATGVPTSLDAGERFSDWDMIIFDVNTTSNAAIFGSQTTQTFLASLTTIIGYFLGATGFMTISRLSDTTFQLGTKTVAAGNISRVIGVKL
jgi:hypothetical protein